jgi:hypothetical protein
MMAIVTIPMVAMVVSPRVLLTAQNVGPISACATISALIGAKSFAAAIKMATSAAIATKIRATTVVFALWRSSGGICFAAAVMRASRADHH